MRLIVCGGRNFNDREAFWKAMANLRNAYAISMIIHGCANGADYLASQWAIEKGVPELRFPADWGAHGRAAGPIRNRMMVVKGMPDGVIWFPGGRGTKNMISVAEEYGVQTFDGMGWAAAYIEG